MDFVQEEKTLMDIGKKFEHFKAFHLYYDEIKPKLAEIRKDLAEIKRIHSRLESNMGNDEKSGVLMKLAEDLESFLQPQLEAIKERHEFLELVKQDCDSNESDEGYFRRAYYSPENEDINEH